MPNVKSINIKPVINRENRLLTVHRSFYYNQGVFKVNLRANINLKNNIKPSNQMNIQNRINLKERVIVKYSTKHLASKDKVRFHYALKGRNGKKGFLESIKAEHLSSGIILIKKKSEIELNKFMFLWKIPFSRLEVFVKEDITS